MHIKHHPHRRIVSIEMSDRCRPIGWRNTVPGPRPASRRPGPAAPAPAPAGARRATTRIVRLLRNRYNTSPLHTSFHVDSLITVCNFYHFANTT